MRDKIEKEDGNVPAVIIVNRYLGPKAYRFTARYRYTWRTEMSATVHAKPQAFYAELAKSMLDEQASAFLLEGLEAEETARRRPIDLMYYLQFHMGDKFKSLPEPELETGNNPDLVQYTGIDPRSGKNMDTPVSTYRLIWWNSDLGAENTAKIRALNSKEGRTPQEDAEIAKLTQRETQGVKKLRQAVALAFQLDKVNAMQKVGAMVHGEFIDKDDNVVPRIEAENLTDDDYTARGIRFEPSASNKPVWLFGLVTYKDKHGNEQTVPNPEGSVNLSVSGFLSLNPEPFDKERNPGGIQGDDLEALRKTSRKQSGAEGATATAENGPEGTAVTKIKNDEQFAQYSIAMIDYLTRVVESKNWAKSIKNASDETVMELATLHGLLSEVMGVIGERAAALNEAAEKAAGNGKAKAA